MSKQNKGNWIDRIWTIPKYVMILLFILLTGCLKSTYNDFEIPCETPPAKPIRNIRVALALGTGGFRSVAHLGAIEVLEKEGVPIDLIVGTSAGSLIGAIYCDNPNIGEIKEEILELNKDTFIEKHHRPIEGIALKRFIVQHLRAKNFEELKIPLVAVATDLNENRIAILRSGPIAPAVLASCADPLVFKPVQLYGQTLIDGGILEPIPVRTARLFKPKMVIAVNLSSHAATKPVKQLRPLLIRCIDIAFFKFSKLNAAEADVTIHPYFYDVGTYDDKHNLEAYEAGKQAAYAALPKIRAEMKRHGIELHCRRHENAHCHHARKV